VAKETKREGYQSAAGLIRYFDSEDEKAPKIPPWFVVSFAVVLAIVVAAAGILWPV